MSRHATHPLLLTVGVVLVSAYQNPARSNRYPLPNFFFRFFREMPRLLIFGGLRTRVIDLVARDFSVLCPNEIMNIIC